MVLTETGFRTASERLGVNLDDPSKHLLLSAVHVALHAEALLRRDRDYVVRDGPGKLVKQVELVDEWTGRVAENRRWPHGIQPAVEAKEGLAVRPEGRILGSIPMQHFIRQYRAIAGMTATAETAAEEFRLFFGLKTVVFPPNRSCRRVDEPDVVFTHRDGEDRRARGRNRARSRDAAGRFSSAPPACASRRSWRRSCGIAASAARC